MSMLRNEKDETDGIEVAWEDQQRINAFSKFNTRLEDIRDVLKKKNQEKEYYDDLEMELELADEDSEVLYRIGGAFFPLPLPTALARLESDKAQLEAEIAEEERRVAECEEGMRGLKVELYAKFGNQINLEAKPQDD